MKRGRVSEGDWLNHAVKVTVNELINKSLKCMSRKGPIVGKGMLDFVEDIAAQGRRVFYWPGQS